MAPARQNVGGFLVAAIDRPAQSGCAIHLLKIDVGTLTNEVLERGVVAPHDSVGDVATGGMQLDDYAE